MIIGTKLNQIKIRWSYNFGVTKKLKSDSSDKMFILQRKFWCHKKYMYLTTLEYLCHRKKNLKLYDNTFLS